jgi:hypothetical protein
VNSQQENGNAVLIAGPTAGGKPVPAARAFMEGAILIAGRLPAASRRLRSHKLARAD